MELSERQLAVIAVVGISDLRTSRILKNLDDNLGAQFGGSLSVAGPPSLWLPVPVWPRLVAWSASFYGLYRGALDKPSAGLGYFRCTVARSLGVQAPTSLPSL